MHITPRAYAQHIARSWPGGRILELGSRDVNGSVRSLFQRRPPTFYHGIDLVAGAGVDQVIDAAAYTPDEPFDLVLCLEVFEHAPAPATIIDAAWRSLKRGGHFVFTCAGPARAPHGAAGGLLEPGEWYCNITIADVRAWMKAWRLFEVGYMRGELDLVGQALRP